MSWGRGGFLSKGRQFLFHHARKGNSVPSSTVPRIVSGLGSNTLSRCVSPTPVVPVAWFTSQSSGSDQHALFLQQLQELERERKQFFGEDGKETNTSDNAFTTPTISSTPRGDLSIDSNDSPLAGEFELDMEELHAEREALFQFTNDEKEAWKNQAVSGTSSTTNSFQGRLSPQLLKDIEAARAAAAAATTETTTSTTDTNVDSTIPSTEQQHHEAFSHISQDSKSIHMVDVGPKPVTTRTARAQSIIRLPPEVIEAFDIQQSSSSSSSELVGPKGPIFATAKLAGIMAAKKTSDLIPLCHPLPLDQVQIDIHMSPDNPDEIIVECTCRVTHKTGVEMEALTGASVAALTIYDMVKAVSHRVEITSTKLLTKTGGKRNLGTSTHTQSSTT